MKIKSFHIDQFGVFQGQGGLNLSAGMNIFLGSNEAGKSTLMHFFRAMFFGYKNKRAEGFDYTGAGKNGGSLMLETAQGQAFTLARKQGTHGGPYTLQAANGTALPQSFLQEHLGGYTSDLYDQVFCFGLSELASLKGMAGPSVAGVLHAAAFGTGFTSPYVVLNALNAKSDALFKPNGKKQKINTILQRLEAIDGELADMGSELKQFEQLSLEKAELEKTLVALSIATGNLRLELGRVTILASSWPEWLNLQNIESRLASTPKPEGIFSPESRKNLELVNDKLIELRSALNTKQARLEKYRTSADEAAKYAPLAAVWPECQTLQSVRGSVAEALDIIPVTERKIELRGQSAAERLSSLGPDWNMEKARAFSDTLLVRNEITTFRNRLLSCSQQSEQAGQNATALKTELEDVVQAEQALRVANGQPVTDLFNLPQFAAFYTAEARTKLSNYHQSIISGGEKLKEARSYLEQLQERHSELSAQLATQNKKLAEQNSNLLAPETVNTLQAELTEYKAASALSARLAAELAQHKEQGKANAAQTGFGRPLFAVISLLVATLCFMPVFSFFNNVTGAGLTEKLFNLQNWQLYLSHNALTFVLGFGFTALALFLLTAHMPFWGRYSLKANAAFTALSANYTAATQRLEQLAAALIKKITSLELPCGNILESNTAVTALNAVLPELENTLNRQLGLRGMVQALFESCREHEEQLEVLSLKLAQAESDFESAQQNQVERIRQWDEAVSPYSLKACPPETALRIFDLGAQVAGAGKKYSTAKDTAMVAENVHSQASAEWAGWLAAHGFAAGFTPDTVLSALESIGEIKKLAADIDESQSEKQRLLNQIQDFATTVYALADKAGLNLKPTQAVQFDTAFSMVAAQSIIVAFNELYTAVSAAHSELVRLREREHEIEQLETELAEHRMVLKEQEERLAAILKQGCAENVEDYLLKHGQFTDYSALKRQQEQSLTLLRQSAQTVLPGGEALWCDFDEFITVLRGSNSEFLAEQKEQLGIALHEAEQKEKNAHTSLGKITQNLDSLSSGNTSAALKAEAAQLEDELAALARQWSVYGMAKAFIKTARRNFEEERNDSVIKQAGDFFALMTGGRYTQIQFDVSGDKEVKAFAYGTNGIALDSDIALSQGTREQLYLALRLAFIRQHNLTKESLPLIMDDILVNFDAGRAEKTAEIFSAFCENNQGLFFTCHPHIAKTLAAYSPGAAVYNVDKGIISAS